MFLRCWHDCIMWLCFGMLPIIVLSFGAALKKIPAHLIVLHLYGMRLCCVAHNWCGERVGVGEGKQLLFLLFPPEVIPTVVLEVKQGLFRTAGLPLCELDCGLSYRSPSALGLIKLGQYCWVHIFGIWKTYLLTWMIAGSVCVLFRHTVGWMAANASINSSSKNHPYGYLLSFGKKESSIVFIYMV